MLRGLHPNWLLSMENGGLMDTTRKMQLLSTGNRVSVDTAHQNDVRIHKKSISLIGGIRDM